MRTMAETYIQSHNTCALATGTGDYVRCTPIEYGWHDSCFWMFSEGGKKFIGLEKNPHVCLAIFDGMRGLDAPWMQGHGLAELVEPFSEAHNAHAAWKNIPLETLRKLSSPSI